MTNSDSFYSFIDKCFPDFPNWVVQLKPKPQNTFNLKSSTSSLEDTMGSSVLPTKEKLASPILVLEINLELQS